MLTIFSGGSVWHLTYESDLGLNVQRNVEEYGVDSPVCLAAALLCKPRHFVTGVNG